MKKTRLCALLLCAVLLTALLPMPALAAVGTGHQITFDPGQGRGTMDPQIATEGTAFAMPVCTFTPPASVGGTNYIFWGWSVTAGDGSHISVDTNDNVYFTSDATATAVWVPDQGYVANATVFGVSSSLTNLTSDNASKLYSFEGTAQYPAIGNSAYEATLTPAQGYALPETITVQLMESYSTTAIAVAGYNYYAPPRVSETFDAGTDYTYDENTGEIVISNATLQNINLNYNGLPARYNIRITAAGVAAAAVATPTFNPAAGTYTSAQMVTISCTTTGATIRYTTDGTDPDESSTTFSAGTHIPVTATTTIKAKAFMTGMTASAVASATYTINTPPPVTDISFISAIADGSAIATTTKVTITLDAAVDGFVLDDITLTDTDNTGATANKLLPADDPYVYELTLTGITKGGSINIALGRTGLTFTPTNRDVTVFYYAPSPPLPPATYAITYHANGGSGTMSNGTATDGVPFELPNCDFTAPDGKQFKTWAIGSKDGTQVNAGKTYIFTEATTVYAIWEDRVLDDVPQTGDSSNIILWVAVLFVSITGMAGTLLYRKKKRHITE